MITVREMEFLKFILVDDSCWNWNGYIDSNGYGQFRIQNQIFVHRISYVLFKGVITSGLVIDHICENRKCVNPKHLEAVTQRENINRSSKANIKKSYCPQGHPYDEQNTRILVSGSRSCRACTYADKQRRRQHNREMGKKVQ